ncbi:hypothetical protein Elgi_18500 [Paenibacillus elgii]|uniref:class I SAM-dependent methyltransferase n=1 Tax=Paenibacillus elgii TaxID=189691 RepID=UPI002D7D4815|nr:hypothetical protein Elgi_18500 [Paenibacillus elgii]
MKDNDVPMGWEHPVVYQYEETIALKIPGYAQELVTFGSRHQDWSFTGMDPSARMLEIAKARVERAGLSHRISFVQASVQELPDGHAFLVHGQTIKQRREPHEG